MTWRWTRFHALVKLSESTHVGSGQRGYIPQRRLRWCECLFEFFPVRRNRPTQGQAMTSSVDVLCEFAVHFWKSGTSWAVVTSQSPPSRGERSGFSRTNMDRVGLGRKALFFCAAHVPRTYISDDWPLQGCYVTNQTKGNLPPRLQTWPRENCENLAVFGSGLVANILFGLWVFLKIWPDLNVVPYSGI